MNLEDFDIHTWANLNSTTTWINFATIPFSRISETYEGKLSFGGDEHQQSEYLTLFEATLNFVTCNQNHDVPFMSNDISSCT